MPLTNITTWVTGDTIEASWANTLRDNTVVLDGRTGGDPGASYAGKVLTAIGSAAGAWSQVGNAQIAPNSIVATQMQSGAAVGNIGYTPLNKGANDIMSGQLTLSNPGSTATGTLYLGQTSGAVYITTDASYIYLGGRPVYIQSTSGLTVNGPITATNDITTYRSSVTTTGYIFFGSPAHYVGWNGSAFTLDGYIPVTSQNIASQSVANATTVAGLTVGNAAGNVPYNNNTMNINLIATLAGGLLANATMAGPTVSNSHINMGTGAQVRWATENAIKLDFLSNNQYQIEVAAGGILRLRTNQHVELWNYAAGGYDIRFDTLNHIMYSSADQFQIVSSLHTNAPVYVGNIASMGHSMTLGLGVAGDFCATGQKLRVAAGRDGEKGSFRCIESPLPIFEDFGRGRLDGDTAVIDIPKDYANYVNTDDYQVFLTAEDPSVLYVAAKTSEYFVVRRAGGRKSARFSWRLVARQGDLMHTERSLPLADVAAERVGASS